VSFWQLYILGFALLFLVGPLALRTILIWRATGRNPLNLESAESAYGFVQLLVKLIFVGYGVVVGLFWSSPATYAQLPAFAALQTDTVRWAGVALTALGLIVTWIAQGQMGRSWRFGPDREAPPPLVTTGIFGVIRNPIYLSMMLASTGMFLLLPDAISLALWVLTIASLNFLVRLEEDFLRGVHGPAYGAYLARVGRFLPGLGLAKSEPPDAVAPGGS
jgi:protein-S-isoprenylcysteine O-methyltransferase Ste14